MPILLLVACGKGGDKNVGKKDGGPAVPVAAPIALPDLGVDKIVRFNFIYEAGASAYNKAREAAKKKDWAEVRKQCEAALAKDPNHLDAHRLLAIALAQTGENAAAVDHLVAAIAGDFYQYGNLAAEPELKEFLATQHGQAVALLASQIKDEYAKRVKGGLWLVARRSSFKWPSKPGVQTGYSRGELYAYDRASKRYFRLTHTDHQVAGFVRSKSGNEVAILGYDKIDKPAGDASAPVIARAWMQAFDPAEWKQTTPRINLPSARAVALYYGDGDQLLVATAPAAQRWTLGDWAAQSVDRSTGKLTKVGGGLRAPRIELTLDEGRIVPGAALEGVQAAWTGDPARAPELSIGPTKIAVPESGQAAEETVALAPDGAELAFATAVDPCATDTAPSLYVAAAKTGALKHLLTAKSRFATRWIDPTTLAYEDGDGGIRLWDVTSGREAIRLENKAGIALDVLSLASAPLCKQAPPTAEPAGSGDELPPEEPAPGAGSGPVTQPQ
ncbi:MAG: hypothetical protein HOV81_30890 [Kofleriaceae bacterium]|nr:hypothetical protein [Kofleriaceae bacterium]